jgi:hypothetical protein
MIEITRTAEGGPIEFEVVVREGKGETHHRVTMSREACEQLTAGKHTPERLSRSGFPILARSGAEGVGVVPFRLPRLGAGKFDHPSPLLGFDTNQLSEVCGRADECGAAQVSEALLALSRSGECPLLRAAGGQADIRRA